MRVPATITSDELVECLPDAALNSGFKNFLYGFRNYFSVMSLTSFIEKPDVKKKFKETFPLPKIKLNAELKAPPKTENHALVGTAFDYLLRFYIKKRNPSAITRKWIAELALDRVSDEKLRGKLEKTIKRANATYERYLKDGILSDAVAAACLRLAKIDQIYRSGRGTHLDAVDRRDIQDLRKLIRIADENLFASEKICLLNPNFGDASVLVGGADADVVIDNQIIDLKTTKSLTLKQKDFHQLIGYYILSKIGAFNGRENLDIKTLSIYFCRHGVLLPLTAPSANSQSIPISDSKLKKFIDWFVKRASQDNPLASSLFINKSESDKTSEISRTCRNYHEGLKSLQSGHEEVLKKCSGRLKSRYDDLISSFIKFYGQEFNSDESRLEIRKTAENFLGSSEISFVAIDGSSHKEDSSGFLSFYGAAYGFQGTMSFSESSGKLIYKRKPDSDKSRIALFPIPPIAANEFSEEDLSNEGNFFVSNDETLQVSSLHRKIMRLAEIYLAYQLATSSKHPQFILIESSISVLLSNTSFSPSSLNLGNADFQGDSFSDADMHIALSRPFNKFLKIPSTKKFQPHFRIIAEAAWTKKRKVSSRDCSEFPSRYFRQGAEFLEKQKAGKHNPSKETFEFSVDVEASWKKSLRIFEHVCEKMFLHKDPFGARYKIRNSKDFRYFSPRDISFLTGIGLRALIETCWEKKILLTGITKDSMSCFFYRNFLGVVNQQRGNNQKAHFNLSLTDQSIAEVLPHVVPDLKSPWSTFEFDSCFMTLHSELDKHSKKWIVKGYDHPRLGQIARPERIFLRSIGQFFLSPDKNLSSQALFIDRLAHPEWDDKDSTVLTLEAEWLGNVSPLFYDEKTGTPRLQALTIYLLSVLVRNRFPKALGYPDPSHEASLGAQSLKRQIILLLGSGALMLSSKPLTKTFRKIRKYFEQEVAKK